MGKGSKPAGNITSTNLTGQKQEPYLTEGWDVGKNLLYQNFNNPNAIVGNAGENLLFTGLDNLYGSAGNIQNQLQPVANNAWQTGATNDIYKSPAYQQWQNFAGNATAPQQQLQTLGAQAANAGQNYANQIAGYAPIQTAWAQQAGANNNLGLSTLGNIAQGQGAGMEQLGQTAGGQYLNGNPYFAQMVQNAMDPITRNYQTSIAPQMDASFASSGRYGSGAMLGQRENAQNTLAQQLSNTSANMYGQNYANERQQQLQAANQYAGLQNQAGSNYGQLYNQGLGMGIQGLANAANTQQGAANTYQQGLQQQLNSINPQINAMMAGTSGLQGGYQAGNAAALNAASMYPQLAQANLIPAQTQMAAGQGYNQWEQQYLDAPYTALKRYTDTIGQPIGAGTSQPYFQNQGANTMAGITGGLDIMSKIGGMAGMGAWIVCTELMRQKRMPWRYWAIGSKEFAAYPEVVQRGYFLWAIPVVRHLRRKPQSTLSRITGAVFRWRAEDLAARHGLKGARRLLRGRMVTWALYPVCAAIGAVAPAQDWQQVYRDASA